MKIKRVTLEFGPVAQAVNSAARLTMVALAALVVTGHIAVVTALAGTVAAELFKGIVRFLSIESVGYVRTY